MQHKKKRPIKKRPRKGRFWFKAPTEGALSRTTINNVSSI